MGFLNDLSCLADSILLLDNRMHSISKNKNDSLVSEESTETAKALSRQEIQSQQNRLRNTIECALEQQSEQRKC
ncbi:28511_t:CDS:2 [Gigaspora margarita]|uniref:28511_t:CDS:1 n=1 Tax=Gigaspora margarita TaxID=4874 RepID=A0ABN7UWZ1_GIGMA|nr:28511_t:CDS:2 [Gigaspora margarita]